MVFRLKGDEKMTNQKYEITDIPHEKYPFLHRIRALRDIGGQVKAGNLGGFVESESNLSFAPGDESWIYDDAIAAGSGFVDKNSRLRDFAVVCGDGYVSHDSTVSAHARVEDDAYVRGGDLCGNARASGHSMVLASPDSGARPVLSERCAVYGTVQGDVHVTGAAVVVSGEEIRNDTLDTLVISEQGRSVIRDPSRDELAPTLPKAAVKEKSKRKDVAR
jgi:hypothetical protein